MENPTYRRTLPLAHHTNLRNLICHRFAEWGNECFKSEAVPAVLITVGIGDDSKNQLIHGPELQRDEVIKILENVLDQLLGMEAETPPDPQL